MKFHLTQLEVALDGHRWTQINAIDEHGNAIGTVEIRTEGAQSASISKLYVSLPVRKMSLGSRLLDRCEKIAKEAGCFSIGLDITSVNRSVIPFYVKNGYVRAFEYHDGGNLLVKFL